MYTLTKRLLFTIIVLLITAVACKTPVGPMTPTSFQQATTTATVFVTSTPEPTRQTFVINGKELLTDGWFSGEDVKGGEKPTLSDMTVTWRTGFGVAGFGQGLVFAPGHGPLTCRFWTDIKDLEHSSIVTTRIIFKASGLLTDGSTKLYLDSSFHQPSVREFYFVISPEAETINFFIGVDKESQDDYISYQFVNLSFKCYRTTVAGNDIIRK